MSEIPYRPETEIKLLEVVRDRLREVLPTWCTTATCFVADEPIPPVVPSTDPVVTIVLDDTRFDPDYFSGGGPMQATSDVTILVTVLTRCVLDSPPKAEVRVLDAQRGIIGYRNQIITALLVSDDSCETARSPWQPLSHDQYGSNYFLRDYGLVLMHATGPRKVVIGEGTTKTMLAVHMQFTAKMDIALRQLDTLQQL